MIRAVSGCINNNVRVVLTMVDRTDNADKTGRDSLVMTAFQTACFAIIVLNAKLVGDLLYSVIVDGLSERRLLVVVLLILSTALNFLEIANNWASIEKFFDLYNDLLFMIDVLTLGTFFWQIYILSKLEEESELTEDKLIGIIVISYIIIFLLYFVWNIFIVRANRKKDDDTERLSVDEELSIERSGFGRCLQICALSVFWIISMMEKSNFMCALCIILLWCIAYVFVHNRHLDIFGAIINRRN